MTREPPINTIIRNLMKSIAIARKRQMRIGFIRVLESARDWAWFEKDRQRERDRTRRKGKK